MNIDLISAQTLLNPIETNTIEDTNKNTGKENKYEAYTNAKTKEEALIALEELEDDFSTRCKKYKEIQTKYEDMLLNSDNYSSTSKLAAKTKADFTKLASKFEQTCINALNEDILNWDTDIDFNITSSAQKATADCWLLAGINAFNNSEKGAQILKDAVTYDEEKNTYNVEFKGLNKTVEITEKDLYEAHKAHQNKGLYSSGDDDVVLFELAFEKALGGKIGGEDGAQAIDGGDLNYFTGLLTGVESIPISTGFDTTYNLIEENPENYTATLGFINPDGKTGIPTTVKDIDGNDVAICMGKSGHAWSLLSVEGNIVTCTNPVYPDEIVKFPKNEIEKYLRTIDLYMWNLHDAVYNKEENSNSSNNSPDRPVQDTIDF